MDIRYDTVDDLSSYHCVTAREQVRIPLKQQKRNKEKERGLLGLLGLLYHSGAPQIIRSELILKAAFVAGLKGYKRAQI